MGFASPQQQRGPPQGLLWTRVLHMHQRSWGLSERALIRGCASSLKQVLEPLLLESMHVVYLMRKLRQPLAQHKVPLHACPVLPLSSGAQQRLHFQ